MVAKAHILYDISGLSKTKQETLGGTWKIYKGFRDKGTGSDPEMIKNGMRVHFYHLETLEWKLSSVFKSTRKFSWAHLTSQAEIFIPEALTEVGIDPYLWFSHEPLEGMPSNTHGWHIFPQMVFPFLFSPDYYFLRNNIASSVIPLSK